MQVLTRVLTTLVLLLGSASIVAFVVACGGGGTASPLPPGRTPPSKEQEKLQFAQKIRGTWLGLCIDFVDSGEPRSEQRTLTFADGQVKEILRIFDAHGCHTQVVFRDERVSSLGFPNIQPENTDQGVAEFKNLSAREYDICRQTVDMRLEGGTLKTHILAMTFLEDGKEKPVPSADVEPVAYGLFHKQDK